MNRYLIIALFSLLWTSVVVSQNSYWEKTPGPYGGEFDLKRSPNGLMYASKINHGSFYPLNSINSTHEYYYSQDDGFNWQKVINPIFDSTDYHAERIGLGLKGNVYKTDPDQSLPANARTSKVYRSQDFGTSWDLLTDEAPELHLVTELPSGTLIGLNSEEVYRSTDQGQNWTLVKDAAFELNLDISFTNGVAFLFYWYESRCLYSTDDGLTWTVLVNQETDWFYPKAFSSQSGTLFKFNFKDQNKIFRSTDQGNSWTELTIGTETTKGVSSLLELPSGRLLATVNGKLYRSDNNGSSWQLVTTEYPVFEVEHQAVLPDGTIFAKYQYAIYRSVDEGASWEFSGTGTRNSQFFQLEFLSPDSIFAYTPSGLWRSFDSGTNWSKLTDHLVYPGTGDNPWYFALHESGKLAVVKDSFLLWSDNFGDSFIDITPSGGIYYKQVEMSPDGSVLFVSQNGDNPGIFRSIDNGSSWELSFPDAQFFYALSFHPSGRIFAIFSYPFYEDVYYSDNQGISWQKITSIPPRQIQTYKGLVMQNDGAVYTWDNLYKVFYKTTDTGATWIPIRANISLNGINHGDLKVNAAGHFIFGTSSQIWRSVNDGYAWQNIPDLDGDNSYSYTATSISPADYLYLSTEEKGIYRTKSPTSNGAFIEGKILRDADADCSTPDAQEPIHHWIIEAAGEQLYYTETDSLGQYVLFVDTGAYTVSPRVSQKLWWEVCDGPQMIQLDSLLATDTLDFSILVLSECPLISVDLTIPSLRRCFQNTVYVNYCNQGSEPADSAWVDIELDPYLTLASSPQPHEDLGNNTYRFFVGDVPYGECGGFDFKVSVSCDSTILGQTHCITAHGYPDTLCTTVPNWSGAEIQTSVSCLDTLVRFELQNVGPAPSQLLDYIIFEDDVVLMNGQEQYNPGEILTVDLPANGHTWRIETEQEPGHPFATTNQINLAFQEGCGGFQSLGYINLFPVDAFTPSWDQDCVENTGSYDPNDKQGFPTGYSSEHFIRPGQELEYLIRFQNTGTDTAFTVVIRDTLSPWLDPATVRPGASSHPYTWSLSGQGTLSFVFQNIMLPDSNVNESASHGFISFRVSQHPDIPLDVVVYNEADIYFDFNEPIRTNQTWHTIGLPQTVGLSPAPVQAATTEIMVSPLPATDFTVFRRSDGSSFQKHRLLVVDALGNVLRQEELTGAAARIERNGLPEGVYFFRIDAANGKYLGSGKLIFLD